MSSIYYVLMAMLNYYFARFMGHYLKFSCLVLSNVQFFQIFLSVLHFPLFFGERSANFSESVCFSLLSLRFVPLFLPHYIVLIPVDSRKPWNQEVMSSPLMLLHSLNSLVSGRTFYFIFVILVFLRQDLTILIRLALNSLCFPGRPWTCSSPAASASWILG